jgi:NAD(P)-dependent dehydrogenase (short-subunit alcohol dehydrogenase family)
MALFQNKYAVVTGGTQGLGEAIAKELAAEGASGVAVAGRQQQKGEVVAAGLRGAGAVKKSAFIAADLENPADCRRVVREAADIFGGKLDGVVNAAAFTERGTLEDTSAAHWDKFFAINTRAPFIIMQEAAKIMREGGGGAIVNIMSTAAHGGTPELTPYSASKAALLCLTKNAAHSQRRHNIRINGVCPGWMDTPGEDAIQKKFHGASDDWKKKAAAKLPLKKLIQPEEVAALVALLLSARSGVMTGAIIDCDQNIIGAGDLLSAADFNSGGD